MKNNPSGKTIQIDHVIPFSRSDKEHHCISHPNLISLSDGTSRVEIESMNLRALKRKRTSSSQDASKQTCELFGNLRDKDWHAQSAFHDRNVDYYIGVVHKKTASMQLIGVDSTYRLRPSMHRANPLQPHVKNEEEEDKRTYGQQKQDLLNSFGGKRSIQRVAKMVRDNITDEKVDDKTAHNAAAAAKQMLTRDADKGIYHGEMTMESMAPPHDSNATSPEHAYPLLGLVMPPELLALEQEADAMLQLATDPSTLDNPGWHELVWRALNTILGLKELPLEHRKRRMQAAMNLHYLITLANSPEIITYEDQEALMEKMGVSYEVLNCLLQRFTVPFVSRKGINTSCRQKTTADSARIVVHAIIMWMTLSDFKDCRNLGALAEAFGINLKLLLKHANNLGCKVRKLKDQSGPHAFSVSLKVPLVFPPLRKRTGKPQRRL